METMTENITCGRVCFCSMMRIEFNFITTRNSFAYETFSVDSRKWIKAVV